MQTARPLSGQTWSTAPVSRLNAMMLILLLTVVLIIFGLATVSLETRPLSLIPAGAPAGGLVRDCQPRVDWGRYILPDGETLADVARRVGVSVAMLAQANCLPTIETTSGQTLFVPAQPAS